MGQYVQNNVCKACPAGSTCDGTTATKCSAPKYVHNNACITCPAGSQCDGTKAFACPKTTYIQSNVCKKCPVGFTCDGTYATPCSRTTYVNNNVCTPCPPGYTCDGATATACPTSNYIDNNVCKACPAGYTCDGKTATAVATVAVVTTTRVDVDSSNMRGNRKHQSHHKTIKINGGVIAGAVIGSLFVLALIAGIIFAVLYYKRSRNTDAYMDHYHNANSLFSGNTDL